jgi:hypothetical protein
MIIYIQLEGRETVSVTGDQHTTVSDILESLWDKGMIASTDLRPSILVWEGECARRARACDLRT